MRRSALATCVALLFASGPARAGWSESGSIKAWAGPPLNGIAVASAKGEWWAVGNNLTVVRSVDGFSSATEILTPVVTGLSGPLALTSIWISPDATTVHIFGRSRARASFVQGAWTTSTALWGPTQASIEGISFLGPNLGYLIGSALPSGYLARFSWPDGQPDATVTDLTDVTVLGPINTSRSTYFFKEADGLIATGPGRQLLRYEDGVYSMPFTEEGSILNAVHFAGTRGLLVGNTTTGALVRLVDPSGASSSPAGVLPPFANPQDVFVTSSGFAVALGKGGEIAESHDFGATWALRFALLGGAFGRVACLTDGNQCTAVGSYPASGTAAAAVYRNNAPTGTVLVNGLPDGTSVPDDAPICLSASGTDPDGDPVLFLWTDPNLFKDASGALAVQGASVAAPSCLFATGACGGGAFAGVAVQLSDGRLSRDLPVSLNVTHPIRPPSAPALSARGGSTSWIPGQRYTVDATATGDCGTPIAGYDFTAGAPLPAPLVNGSSATFDLAGLCLSQSTPVPIHAVARYGNGVTSPSAGTLEVTLSPDSSAPEVTLASDLTLAAGESRAVVVSASHPCASTFAVGATCDDGSAPLVSGSTLTFSNHNPSLCTPQAVTCSVRVAPTDYAPASAATRTIVLSLEPPVSLPVIAAPSAADFDPSDTLSIRCRAPTSLRIRPRISAPCAADGRSQFRWRQLSELPLDLRNSAASPELEVSASPEQFFALVGRDASLELTASPAPGFETSRSFAVRFVPQPFVRLGHQADRVQAAPGEVVWLSLSAANECPSSVPGGIDLQVSLRGLEYVPGSATLDGARFPEPARTDGGLLAFRGVPLLDSAAPASTLRYGARRRAGAAGWTSAWAQAFLASAPELAASAAAATDAPGPTAALGAVSCGCGPLGGGPALASIAFVLLALGRVRRR